jgi:phosphoribosylanthranilate isomerase
VKICGVRTIAGAEAVKRAGADFAGINFVPTSKRRVELVLARELIRALAPVPAVGVFADQSIEELASIARALDLAYVQLHGTEPPSDCAEAAKVAPVIKALPAGEHLDLSAYEPHVAFFLFDGPRPGSGETFSWDRLGTLALSRPYFVAGGLTPENVGEAIARLSPWGVDTASGVERGGAQDPERILAFVKEARRA